jgi:FlaA1/EpsC-like NDP-sugar epimerase
MQNVLEALRNNVLGKRSVVDAALGADVPHLVRISTDKAVRPNSVMGASKRIAEQITQLAARESGRSYVSVRFGNVLGSPGSVVPTLLQQIEAGEPLLVTHPDRRRYFMTIPEAVQLVLQAFVLGKGEEVFCLDMREPMKIVDLARDLIEFTATPNAPPVEIRFTGTRPGEKIYEELFFDAEHAHGTAHPEILRSIGTEVAADLLEALPALDQRLKGLPSESELITMIRSIVEGFRVDVVADLRTMEHEVHA